MIPFLKQRYCTRVSPTSRRMPLVRVPDAAGKTLLLREYGPQPYYCFPRFTEQVLENIHNIHIRDDDIILCSYPKSGCHWLWEMARFLRAGTTEMEMVEKEMYMMEFVPDDDLLNLPPKRILNTHVSFGQLPQKVQDGQVKILFIYRNPKDLAVSFYNHHKKCSDYEYQGGFDDYLSGLFLAGKTEVGSVFDHLKDWEKVMDSRPNLPIFVVSYEELQSDTFGKLKALAKFMNSSVDEDTIRQIVDKCSLKCMRERKGKFWTAMYGEPVMYRKGKVGGWKNFFTVAQSEMMDKVIEKEMKGSRFCFQYTLQF